MQRPTGGLIGRKSSWRHNVSCRLCRDHSLYYSSCNYETPSECLDIRGAPCVKSIILKGAAKTFERILTRPSSWVLTMISPISMLLVLELVLLTQGKSSNPSFKPLDWKWLSSRSRYMLFQGHHESPTKQSNLQTLGGNMW